MVNSAEYSGISRKYRVSEDAISRHVKQGHVSKAIKAAVDAGLVKHGKNLDDRINEIYNMSIKAGTFALSEKDPSKRDLRSFGSCMSPAVKMAELLHEKDGVAELQKMVEDLQAQMKKQ